MTVIWSPRANRELAKEVEWIAGDRSGAAGALVDRLEAVTQHLERFPLMGKVVPEFRKLGVREIVIVPYRLIYHVAPDQVTILTLKHSRERSTRREVQLPRQRKRSMRTES